MYFQKIFPLRGQFIHCDFIYTKNSGGRPCRKSMFYWGKIGQRLPIFGFWSGDDATENGDFQREKQRLQGSKIFWLAKFSWIWSGGDATENRDFQRGKQRLQGYKNFWIAILVQKFSKKKASISKNVSAARAIYSLWFYLHKEFRGATL